DEDLSRFTQPETLHTISSILEARALAGNAALLEELKGIFRGVLPLEGYLKQKMDEFEALGRPTLTSMDLKEDAGGLRSIQVPLWIFGVLYEQSHFMTADLLAAARARGLLSLHEVARLLQGLELLYELRNFVGAAERYYYDQEARDSECQVNDFPKNRINDSLARLYLFRKRRFASVDAFDTHRLWLMSEVQALSLALLRRVLDRTHAHNLGPFWISVHLGRKQITAIDSIRREPAGALSSRFPDGARVLQLFEYIAHTDYDLTDELRDAMAEVVPGLHRPRGAAERAAQAQRWANLISAPYAHRALANLFGIRDPLEGEISTLMGRFIPEFNRIPYLLRNLQTLGMPLHEHILQAMAFSQKGLEALKESHPDLFHLLGPQHVLALKWSVFLHSSCALEGSTDDPARSAELAADLLARLGFKDAALESLVRLLIEHHRSVLALCKTSSYMDQALAQYFEIAGRDIVHVVLLYLINMAVLQA
ncbi:MAG TPA: hypothetical protein VL359_19990, partial [bacterium]|nr:hypothetical protein [bacterium]